MAVSITANVIQAGLLDGTGKLDKLIRRNASRAINKETGKARTRAKRAVLERAALKSGEVNSKLTIQQKASPDALESTIHAPARPNTLRRFVIKKNAEGQTGIVVRVKKGQTKVIPDAFIFRGKGKGGSTAPGLANELVALRLTNDAPVYGRKKQRQSWKGLAFLDSVSLPQILLDNQKEGVFAEEAENLPNMVADEFVRLMNVEGLGST